MLPREISQPFYSSMPWRKTRAAYIISVNGLCERCLKKGLIVKGRIVHHIIYLTEENINNPELTLNWDNLEYLCQDCHNKEHFGTSDVLEEGLMFDVEGNLIQIETYNQDLIYNGNELETGYPP